MGGAVGKGRSGRCWIRDPGRQMAQMMPPGKVQGSSSRPNCCSCLDVNLHTCPAAPPHPPSRVGEKGSRPGPPQLRPPAPSAREGRMPAQPSAITQDLREPRRRRRGRGVGQGQEGEPRQRTRRPGGPRSSASAPGAQRQGLASLHLASSFLREMGVSEAPQVFL